MRFALCTFPFLHSSRNMYMFLICRAHMPWLERQSKEQLNCLTLSDNGLM